MQSMKKILKDALVIVCVAALPFAGCARKEKPLPKETPGKVVAKFYSLLKKGGFKTLMAARDLTNADKVGVSVDNFRRYTEAYSKQTKVTVLETRILDKRTARGERVAEVKIAYKMPSTFGGFMNSTTQVHLILDKESNIWKIDFLATTINEERFKGMAGKK